MYIYIYNMYVYIYIHTSKYFTEKMDVFYIEYLIYIYIYIYYIISSTKRIRFEM